MGTARAGYGTAMVGGKICVIGGMGSGHNAVSSVECFDPATGVDGSHTQLHCVCLYQVDKSRAAELGWRMSDVADVGASNLRGEERRVRRTLRSRSIDGYTVCEHVKRAAPLGTCTNDGYGWEYRRKNGILTLSLLSHFGVIYFTPLFYLLVETISLRYS